MPAIHPVIAAVTEAIEARSKEARADYEARMRAARPDGPAPITPIVLISIVAAEKPCWFSDCIERSTSGSY